MSPIPLDADTIHLEAGDIVEIHSEILGHYRAMFIEHSMETAGAIWVKTSTHRLLIGRDGRLLVSSRQVPYQRPDLANAVVHRA